MNQEIIESYWENISNMKSARELNEFLKANTQMADGALEQIAALTEICNPIQVSVFNNSLLTLGLSIAESSDNTGYFHRFSTPIYFIEAIEAMTKGQKEKAIEAAFSAAKSGLQVKNAREMIDFVCRPALLLLRFGAIAQAYDVLNQFVNMLKAENINGNQLYTIFSVCKYVPATTQWITLFRRLRDRIKETGNLLITKVADCHLGIFAVRSGAYEKGLVLLCETEDLLSKSGLVDKDNSAIALEENFLLFFWKARALDLTGKESDAETYYRAYLSNEKNDQQKRAIIVIQLAEQLIDNDRFIDALDLLEQQVIVDPRYHSYSLLLSAYIYTILNRLELSKYFLSRADALLRGDIEPVLPGMGSALENAVKQSESLLVSIYAQAEIDWKIKITTTILKIGLENSDDDHSITASDCLEFARDFGEHMLEVLSLQVLAKLAFENNELERALNFFQQAYETELSPGNAAELFHSSEFTTLEYDTLRTRTTRMEAGLGIRSGFEVGRMKKILNQDPSDDWNKVITGARIQNKRLLLFNVLNAKAEWLHSMGKTNDAISCWEESIDLLDILRAEFQDIESQVGILQNKENAFANLLISAVKNGTDDLVIRLMERAKSRALLETISSGTSTILSRSMSEKAKIGRQSLVRAMREEMKSPGSRINEINLLKEQLSTVFSSANKKRNVMKLGGGTTENVVHYSQSGKAVIHYFVTEQDIVIGGSVNGNILKTVCVNCSRTNLQDLVDTFHYELGRLESCNSLFKLYEILIKPIELYLDDINELIIIPHDLLHGIPFQALRKLNGSFLVEDFAIRYVPSIAIALSLQQDSDQNNSLKSFVLAAGKLSYIDLPVLTSIETETEAIMKFIPGASFFSDLKARRRELIQNKENLEILHLACHGKYDIDDPLLSRLYLGDGPIYGYEIEKFQFSARVVVLSACETGMQNRLAGDETFGLVRAFLSRGSQAIVASLWTVSDEATGLLMESFYQNYIEKGEKLGTALRLAQLSLIQSEDNKHPFWWSPYILIGGNFSNKSNE